MIIDILDCSRDLIIFILDQEVLSESLFRILYHIPLYLLILN